MSKHTPGPWKVDSYGGITGGPNYLTSVAETFSYKWAHCEATSAHKHSQEAADYCGQMFDEAKANAALIAAAPAIADTIQFVADALAIFQANRNEQCITNSIERLQQALATIRGEE